MKFPCKVEVQIQSGGFLPQGTYTAVGRIGKHIVVEYHLGWRYIYNRPPFCTETGKYAQVHENCVTPHGKQRNGKPVSKNWKEINAVHT